MSDSERNFVIVLAGFVTLAVGYHLGLKAGARDKANATTPAPMDSTDWLMTFGGAWR